MKWDLIFCYKLGKIVEDSKIILLRNIDGYFFDKEDNPG